MDLIKSFPADVLVWSSKEQGGELLRVCKVPNQTLYFFTGETHVFTRFKKGTIQAYTGAAGEEHLIWKYDTNGEGSSFSCTQFFHGPRLEEVLVRQVDGCDASVRATVMTL